MARLDVALKPFQVALDVARQALGAVAMYGRAHNGAWRARDPRRRRKDHPRRVQRGLGSKARQVRTQFHLLLLRVSLAAFNSMLHGAQMSTPAHSERRSPRTQLSRARSTATGGG
jgi:hypothetical protein